MEDWIPRALDAGVKGVMVWFFIGMPYQDRQSVLDTVAYSERLIRKFGGWDALPLICPMVPFLDPGCRFFEEPEQHGYRIFHRTLEEHRRAMVEPLWYRRLNYETRWLDRRQLQDVSYEAIARLVEIKGEYGVLPPKFCQAILRDHRRDTATARGDGKSPAARRDAAAGSAETRSAPTTARSSPIRATRSFRCAGLSAAGGSTTSPFRSR